MQTDQLKWYIEEAKKLAEISKRSEVEAGARLYLIIREYVKEQTQH